MCQEAGATSDTRVLLSRRSGCSVYHLICAQKGLAVRRLALLLLAAAPLVPGSHASGQTTFSLHGGPNRTMLSEIIEDTVGVVPRKPVHGMHAGLGVTFWLTPRRAVYTFGIRLSGTYAQRGAAHTVFGQKSLIRLHYLLGNVMYDMRFPFRWERLRGHFSAGPTLGRLVACQREFDGVDGDADYARSCPDGEYRRLEFALTLGGGLELGVTDNVGITTGVQYHWGGRDIERNPGTRMLNRALALRGGLVYTLR